MRSGFVLIHVNEETKQFHLTNEKISYIFHVMKNGQLGHLHYGKRLHHREDFSHLQRYDNPTSASCHPYEQDPAFSLETSKQEYPSYGTSDFREPAVSIRRLNGSHVTNFQYHSYRLVEGKPALEGLPATYAEKDEAETLQIVLKDSLLDAELVLNYTIFKNYPVITRSVQLINHSEEAFYVERLMSASVDFEGKDFSMIHLSGAWSRERHVKERPLETGIQAVSSIRGASSHHHNPFLALKRPFTTEETGEAYGFNFVYSSNFLAQVEVDHYDVSRVTMGIHPFRFEWKLNGKETLQSPEVVMTYSAEGLNGMSQAFHNVYRTHLIKKQWREVERPILINNWEATYFDFDEEKLVNIATEAQKLGIELFVLDDGWFGKRDNDTSSLGDWWEDKAKLPNGLERVSQRVHEAGLQFGLWFEPEMISLRSELFQEHSEWAIQTPDREMTFGRNQFVLDFSRPEIVEYLYEKMAGIIQKTGLSYIKWDMNRYITEAYSTQLNEDQQGEFFHRYILGVYRLYDKLTQAFPNVLFESCAGGGGRFDPALLHYAPQAWASDDTDAVERLKIQYGTSFAYPIYSIGSHVSAVPNHQTLRETPIETRAATAYFGTFGYELNPLELSEEEKEAVKQQISFYKEQRKLIRDGSFYRLKSPFQGNETSWAVVSQDQTEVLVGYYKVLATPTVKTNQTLRIQGLKLNAEYVVDGYDQTFYGDELTAIGLPLPVEFNGVNGNRAERGGDYQAQIFYLRQKQ